MVQEFSLWNILIRGSGKDDYMKKMTKFGFNGSTSETKKLSL